MPLCDNFVIGVLYPYHTPHTTDIKQTCAIYIHLLYLCIQPQEAITIYCAHLHHTLAALKRYFPASLVASLPNSDKINLISSIHTYAKSRPKHIYHHYAPSVTLTHTQDTHHLFNCTHIRPTLSPLDL